MDVSDRCSTSGSDGDRSRTVLTVVTFETSVTRFTGLMAMFYEEKRPSNSSG